MTTYTALEKAKDGNLIPFCNAVALHSKYNPLREAEQFASQFSGDCTFFVILGLAGGYHIQALQAHFPEAQIVVIETTQENIDYLKVIPCVARLFTQPQLHICTIAACASVLQQTFRPAEHSHIQITTLRAWQSVFASEAESAQKSIQSALQRISADFSVQSHFGALWQRNIFLNLAFVRHIPHYAHAVSAPKKTAAIIAAGPSLDESISQLADGNYYIIATDTAYPALLRRGITADAVVSVDAQMISHAHFFYKSTKTLFVFDLSANPAAIRRMAQSNAPVLLAETGHPISQLAARYDSKVHFPHIETGSGTVTIAAAAFAVQAGFTELAFFGADFAYSKGKPYTKGCYLDDTFFAKANRLASAEMQFCKLMYRTELQAQEAEGTYTTTVLQSYKEALACFLAQNGFTKAGNVYKTTAKPQKLATAPFTYTAFLQAYDAATAAQSETMLLPYAAWLQMHAPGKLNHKEILNLAHTKSLRYTKSYEN